MLIPVIGYEIIWGCSSHLVPMSWKKEKGKEDNSEPWHCCVDKLIIPGLCTWLSPTPIFIVVKYT